MQNQRNLPKNIKKYEVYDKLNEICSPIFGQLYHIDLLYITTYIFRICKIKDMLTRNDKRSKYSLLAHLEQLKKQILPVISQKDAQTALLDSVYKERCLCRGQKPFPGGSIIQIKNKNQEEQSKKEEKDDEDDKTNEITNENQNQETKTDDSNKSLENT